MDIKQEHEERAKEGLWGEIPFRNVSKKDFIYMMTTIFLSRSNTNYLGRTKEVAIVRPSGLIK